MSLIFYKSIGRLTIFISFLLLGCASHKKVNRLAAQIECEKTFYFSYDDRSDFVGFDYYGDHSGKSDFPDFKRTFRRSIEELDVDTEMDLSYVDSKMFPSSESIYAEVRIEEIRWKFGFSGMKMEVDLSYDLGGEKIFLTGKNKVKVAGTKEGNLFKALKHGHFMFISSFCDQ
nr:hypothetical protein [uncultured Allomuricauda sp.]